MTDSLSTPKLEDDDSLNPTADEVMDSTEMRDSAEEEDTNPRKRRSIEMDTDEAADQPEEDDDAGGLFGSGSEGEEGAGSVRGKRRKLDDEEIDSGNDEDRLDPGEDELNNGYGDEEMQVEQNVTDLGFHRHTLPHGSDGELYLLKFPNFMGIESKKFAFAGFQPPATDHHSTGPPSTTFTPADVARNTIRWRRSPRNPKRLQSNARIIRWSNGSLTLQLATKPKEQFELPAKPLVSPQQNPIRPTPTAVNDAKVSDDSGAYDARMESHTYLASVHQETEFAQITNHLTASLTVQSTTDQNDDALIRLQESMAAALKGNKTTADGSVGVIRITEDPELAKKKAEQAEKEKIRAQRRRQQQEEKERDRANRVLGRSGMRTGGIGGGLTIGGLEDEDGFGSTRTRAKPARKAKRRNSEYSEDEEDYRNRGRTREDEYDEDDGFLVRSDEEPELVPDDSEEEEEEMDNDEAEAKEKTKRKSSKISSGTLDASGPDGRTKRRRVVDEDDDEE